MDISFIFHKIWNFYLILIGICVCYYSPIIYIEGEPFDNSKFNQIMQTLKLSFILLFVSSFAAVIFNQNSAHTTDYIIVYFLSGFVPMFFGIRKGFKK